MKQKTSAFCVAAAFGCIATLGAQTQQTATTTSQQNATRNSAAHDVTITGCLAKESDGRFTLTNARLDDPIGTSTTAGSTSTSSTAESTTAGSPAGKTRMPATATTWMLGGGSDLDKHLGHKIQVTGKTMWDGSMDHARMPAGTSTTAASTTAETSTTAGTAGTTGTASTTGEQRKSSTDEGKGNSQPRLDVQSVKMIASSCS